jgi:hypothetical protein
LGDVADDHRKGGFFGGRQGAGGFAVDGGIIYGGAVGGDLKGLEKIGGEGVFVIRNAVLL